MKTSPRHSEKQLWHTRAYSQRVLYHFLLTGLLLLLLLRALTPTVRASPLRNRPLRPARQKPLPRARKHAREHTQSLSAEEMTSAVVKGGGWAVGGGLIKEISSLQESARGRDSIIALYIYIRKEKERGRPPSSRRSPSSYSLVASEEEVGGPGSEGRLSPPACCQ